MERPFISESELARLANIPATRLRKLKSKGLLKPDFTVGKTYSYRSERVPELIEAHR